MEDDALSQMIDQLSSAILRYPDDPDAQIALADLLIHRFRLKEFQSAMANQMHGEKRKSGTRPIRRSFTGK